MTILQTPISIDNEVDWISECRQKFYEDTKDMTAKERNEYFRKAGQKARKNREEYIKRQAEASSEKT